MSSNLNQEIEHHYFELFRKSYLLPDGEVKFGDKPDIILEGTQRLEIEVTNFYIERGEVSESLQNQRRVRKVVLKKACQKYINKGGKYEMSFSFNKNNPIRNSRKLIPKIVEIICRLEALKTGGLRISNYFSDIPELDFVYINPNIYNDHHWRNVQSYTGVETMSLDNLEQILRK